MVGQMDSDARLVAAARAGDQESLDELVAQYLPLVYNIVGRALARHGDVDDVVQETMLRVVRGLGGLREPERFRSWLVAVAMNQVREHARTHRDTARLEEIAEPADPGADFVDLTLVELGLSGQRREAALATRWLDPDDRHLLSLWWLVNAGHLTRGELVGALDLDPHHVTVRVARMKAQLDIARLVVRALIARPRCPGLSEAASSWHGEESPLWRKRFARHVRECGYCSSALSELIPAERLLAGLGLVPLPAGYAAYMLASTHGVIHGVTHLAAASSPMSTQPLTEVRIPGQRGAHGSSHRAAAHGGHAGRFAVKPLLAVVAVTAVAAGGLVTVHVLGAGTPAAARSPRALSTSAPAVVSLSPGASSSAAVTAAGAAPSAKPSPSPAKPGPSTARSQQPPVATTSTAVRGGSVGTGQGTAVQQVLDLINQARAQAGLPAYTITSGLTSSATTHNQTMAGGCGLSHQCPGEAPLGNRETAAGVQWTSAGENIGEGGPVSDTQAAIAQMAVGLTQSMLNEQPPDDGHRQNILSASFHHIGIAVFRDGSGTVWMTQDFSN